MANEEIRDFFNNISDSWDNLDDDISLINELLKETKIKENDDVLDVGCGKGIITPFLYGITKKQVTAIDIADKMIEGAKEKHPEKAKYNFICGDFLEYRFDKTFDYVVIYNAYPHFLDKEKLKNKAYDVLNNNGKLVIMHSIGRNKLNEHHHNVMNISVRLESVDKEVNKFSDKFVSIKTIDTDDRYLIIVKKV